MKENRNITFEIEELGRAKDLVEEKSYTDILKELITLQSGFYPREAKTEMNDFEIIAQSKVDTKLVNYGYHAFFNGMHKAYAEHRPFVLSPDMIWLLISQGFAKHIINNAEELRHHFVDFNKQMTIIVKDGRINIDDPGTPWELIFPQFMDKIAKFTGIELINNLTSNFTTTTVTEQIASQITIMEAMKVYFRYNLMYAVCGIPEITLEGTTEDWERLIKKAKKLTKYSLSWWINDLVPILEQFVEASQNKIDIPFWRNMFKYHTPDEYGAPDMVDGWITKFFPYDKTGNRTEIPIPRGLVGETDLPEEIIKVDLLYIKDFEDGTSEKMLLELWSGFVGLEQDKETLALRPKIGWMIRKKDLENKVLNRKVNLSNSQLDQFPSEERKNYYREPISISVFKDIPNEILSLKTIDALEIYFEDVISIPREMSNINIDQLYLSGTISIFEEYRILKMFPNTVLLINRNDYFLYKVNIVILRLFIGKVNPIFKNIGYFLRGI